MEGLLGSVVARPLVEAVKVSKPFPKDAPWAQKKGPISEAQLLSKHPHAIPGSRQYDAVAKKWAMTIQCACGAERIVYTSDLHHVRTCRACKAKADAAKAIVAPVAVQA